jgi:hypothetical protein
VQAARFVAFSPEEAIAYLRKHAATAPTTADESPPLRREAQLDSAADVARSMREFLRARLESWQ